MHLSLCSATVVDGTGRPGFEADVWVDGGRVVAVGGDHGPADRTIDATGLVVCPGFIDLHTHYDAQLCWDPYATPSILHGVTSVVGGNCGFSVAPARPEDRDYLARLLAKVEGMPLDVLERTVPWDWRSFGDYLDRFEGRLALNAGFFVGHSALRRTVMGDDAHRGATPDEVAAMVRLLDDGLAAGGLGFSTSVSPTHHDGDGRPVPSRCADREELIALSAVVRRHAGTALEIVPPPGAFSDEHVALMADMSVAADRPINWNLLNVSATTWDACEQRLHASQVAAARGGSVVALTLPCDSRMRLNLASGFMFDALPGWTPLFELPVPARLEALRDPARRHDLRGAVRTPVGEALWYLTRWGGLTVGQVFSSANAGLTGRTVSEIAAARGVDELDCLLDLAVADGLQTVFVTPWRGDDPVSWELRRRALRDGRTVVGGSDAGAHLDMLDTFNLPTTLLGNVVRERGLLGLEEAIHLLTGAPASLYGMVGRGTIAPGAVADLVLFDPDRIGAGDVALRSDLPGGAPRLYGEASGIAAVVVHGTEVVRDGELTGALPGKVLRSGRDTCTVTAGEMLARQGLDAAATRLA